MSYKLRRYGKTENWLTGSRRKAKYIKFNKINIEKKFIKDLLEEIIDGDEWAIINPYDANVDERIKKLIDEKPRYMRIISSVIDEEEKKIDCYYYRHPKDAPKENDPCKTVQRRDKIWGNKIGSHVYKLKKNRPNRFFEPVKTPDRSGSPDTVTADNIYTPANFEGGGRKKTRRRRKKKSKRKKTRRRRKKKKTRRKKKKKRKKSKRKKRSRKLRGGNYWRFNEDTKKYEFYTSNDIFGRSKIVKFNSLTDFTKYMCMNHEQIIKKYPGMKKHPHIFNINDPELIIKESKNDGVNIYQYRCGNCGKIITYYDGEKKSIHFPGWNFTKLPSPDKKEQNLDKFDKFIKKYKQQEQSINDVERGRSGSAPNLINPIDVSQDEYKKPFYEVWEPDDGDDDDDDDWL